MYKIFETILNQNKNVTFLDFDNKDLTIETRTKEISLKKEELNKIFIEKRNIRKQKIGLIIIMFLILTLSYFLLNFSGFVLTFLIMLPVFVISLLRLQKYKLYIYSSKGNFTFHIPKDKIENIKKIVKEVYKEKNKKRKIANNENSIMMV